MDIALSVGGAFLSSFLQVLFDRMATPEFLNLFREREYDGKLLKKFKRKLLVIQAVLDDAESKQSGNSAVKEWLHELHDAVYQADDLLDEINTEALRVKVETEYLSTTNQVSASTQIPNLSNEFLKETMPKIEEMLETLDDFVQQIQVLGLNVGEPRKQPRRQSSTSLLVDNCVYGRDADKERIIQMLLSDGENGDDVNVIPIVGLGGIGKTTLAQSVYNDQTVQNNFDTRAWVCISEEYDAIRITKALLEELNMSSSDSNDNLNSLQLKLQQGLAEKKFLLVLDDVWNRNYNEWETLKAPFGGGKQGSRIIVTTRDERIAMMMRNGSIYHLNLMLEKDCWSLFEKHALGNLNCFKNPEFEQVGRDIVKKCGGLPLAVKALAGLLRSKETVEEWKDIVRSDIWDQPNDQTGILPALRISYNHLPSHLKRCFAYCSVFHKDYQFTKDEVIMLWMANDLLEYPRNNKRIEDIGEEYFHELRLRSLFQLSSDKKFSMYERRLRKFSMHDCVNDLAKSICGKYFHRQDYGQEQNLTLDRVVRHFSYIWHPYATFQQLKGVSEAKFLRTFLVVSLEKYFLSNFSKKNLHDILSTFRSLRVLSVRGYRITESPDSFSNLKRLRFLDLSFTNISELPEWIFALYNLQTLLLVDCYNLKELPDDMAKLINLRYLDVTGTSLRKMPMQIKKLKNLQVLTTFVGSRDTGPRIDDLGELGNLRGKLTILGLENTENARDALTVNMKGKKHINELSLNWGADSNSSQVAKDVLENLQPHSTVEYLKIEGYCGTRFADWLGDPSFCHLVSLRLVNCHNCFCLPALGQLPCLEYLEISRMSKILNLQEEIYGGSSVTKPFPTLKVLEISAMKELKEWHIPNRHGGVFSSLEELQVTDCPCLIGELPKQLPSLRELTISECPKLRFSDGQISNSEMQVDLSQYSSLKTLTISEMPNLKELPKYLSKLTCLESLSTGYCSSLVSLSLDGESAQLKYLWIQNCENLELQTSETLGRCYLSIENLRITNGCDSLKDVSLDIFPRLKFLWLGNCKNVERLSITVGHQNLTLLDIRGCDNFMSFPEGGLLAPNLMHISLRNLPKLKSLPERMHTLHPSLRSLTIMNCPEIECFPESGLPSTLEYLGVCECEKLISRREEWNLQSQRLPSFAQMRISFKSPVTCKDEETCFPEDWLLPCSLRTLFLSNHPNLKMLNYRGLHHLTSLQTLEIWNFPELQMLPEEGLPASLATLIIRGCQLLKPRLEWEKGEDWPKIAHIPTVLVDEELIP